MNTEKRSARPLWPLMVAGLSHGLVRDAGPGRKALRETEKAAPDVRRVKSVDRPVWRHVVTGLAQGTLPGTYSRK